MEREQYNEMIEDWVNKGNLEKYIRARYDKWIVSFGGNSNEVFIADEEVNDGEIFEEEEYEILFYIVSKFLEDNNIDLGGEETSFITDDVKEGLINIYPLSDMVSFDELELEVVDEKILYIACDDDTKKELMNIVENN